MGTDKRFTPEEFAYFLKLMEDLRKHSDFKKIWREFEGVVVGE